ncbi:hypothetical protein BC628DRAFT_1379985 [Trametes gibbosa]|nr:hypothetical protein BC628DRAFT_1379985 [Trametes gibbosa]
MFARSVVAAFVAAPFVAQVALAASCARQYTVKEGDWCDTISAANNASTYQLAVVNPTIDASCTNLQTGQVICLGTEGEDCKTTHVVHPDDTCDLLTGIYNINSTVLYANNPQIDADCNNLYIGEVVCVAPAIAVPAVPVGSATPAVVIPATATPAKATATPVKTTSVAATTTSAAPEPTETEDDEDLPFCDEL